MNCFASRRLGVLAAAVALVAAPAVRAAPPCFDVKTFAGRGVGDGGPATAALLSSPRNATLDGAGNILIADADNARVRRIDPSGTITTFAGNGAPGIATDGAAAIATSLKEPSGIAVSGGDVFIADAGANVNTVWRVTPDGVIHRFAGSGVATGSIDGEGGDPSDDLNDGQLALFATLNTPVRVAVDAAGNVFIADLGNNRIRRVDAATGVMTSVASGLAGPVGIAIGGSTLFIANAGTNQILKGSTAGGSTSVFAGTGAVGIAADRDPGDPPLLASNAPLHAPAEVAVGANDSSGVVFIGDTGNGIVHRVTPDGIIHRVAGSGIFGFKDGPGFLAQFQSPGVALGPGSSLLVPDADNDRLRRIDPAPPSGYNVTTIAGVAPGPGDGGLATQAVLDRPAGLAVDANANVLVTEHDSHRVRRVDTGGVISTIINKDGVNDSAADGQPAINSPLKQPTGVSVDAKGDVLVADALDHRLLIVDATGLIRTLAGVKNTPGFAGDGGPATSALLDTPLRMALASDGTVYLTDFNNNRVRKIGPDGTINTFVGNGGELNQPSGVVFDSSGNLYVADFGNNRVVRVDPNAGVTLIAGNGTPGYLGDNGQAGAAELNGPTDVAFASDGGLLIVDQQNSVVRYVAPAGDGSLSPGSTIETIIGSGTAGFADGPAPVASLLFPTGIRVDASGNILVADRGNQRVRIASPGTDCPAPTMMCSSASDCDDGNPCTIDACEANHSCSHTALPPDQCQPSCAAEPGGCFTGGGPRKNDCLAETLVKGVQASGVPVVRCKDQDPTCDFDATPGSCGFRLACCFNEPGCSASGVTKVTAKGPAAAFLSSIAKLGASSQSGNTVVFNAPMTTPDACTELTAVTVSLRRNGKRPGKLQLKVVASGSRKRQKDADKIRLICMP
jgi:sugar lactone lactonase YvrE